jgi:HSP20 family protein
VNDAQQARHRPTDIRAGWPHLSVRDARRRTHGAIAEHRNTGGVMALLTNRTRTPVRYTPFAGMDTLRNDLERFFDNPFVESNFLPVMTWLPAVEIVEANNELVLTAELPGMKKEDVQISIENQVLTLTGEKKEELKEDEKDKKYHVFERSYGTFVRTFTLPRAIDATKVNAEFENGILKIHLPKTAEAKGRKIEILTK